MKMEMTKSFRKSVNKYGSVLKAYRSQGGGGKGLFAGGITLLVFAVFLGGISILGLGIRGMAVFAFFGVPGLLLMLWGNAIHGKRMKNYLEYFQKQTGYSAAELEEADRELLSPNAVTIGCKADNSGGKVVDVFMITDHYFVSIWPVNGCYIRKLDDIVAAFYSSQIPGIGGYRQNLFVISRQDIQEKGVENPYTKKQYRGFENGILTMQKDCQTVCAEVVQEMVKRAPHIITYQNIAVNGVPYNLLSMNNWQGDWARILGEPM